MKIFLKDNSDRYLKLHDMEMVFTDKKDEAYNFEEIEIEEFSVLKKQMEVVYDIQLEAVFE